MLFLRKEKKETMFFITPRENAALDAGAALLVPKTPLACCSDCTLCCEMIGKNIAVGMRSNEY